MIGNRSPVVQMGPDAGIRGLRTPAPRIPRKIQISGKARASACRSYRHEEARERQEEGRPPELQGP